MDVPRALSAHVQQAAAQFSAADWCSAGGKATLMRSLCGAERTYITLNDPLVLQVTHEDPAMFLQGYTQKQAVDSEDVGPGVPGSALAQQCDAAAG